MNRQKSNWIIDSLLFVGFLISCWLDLTGVELHQWIGILIGAFALFHLFVHWSWVKSVTTRFFNRTSWQARIFYLIDSGLLLGFFLIVVTGLVISTWFALPLGNYVAWKNFHIIITGLTLVLIVLKIGLHWRWVVTVGSRHVVRPAALAHNTSVASPSSTNLDRRAFLKLMGAVGVMTVLPATNVLDAFAQNVSQGNLVANNTTQKSTTQQSAAPNSTQTTNTSSAQSAATTTTSTTTNTCQVQCSRRCSYPGNCRRYTDSNKNGRCDLGECV